MNSVQDMFLFHIFALARWQKGFSNIFLFTESCSTAIYSIMECIFHLIAAEIEILSVYTVHRTCDTSLIFNNYSQLVFCFYAWSIVSIFVEVEVYRFIHTEKWNSRIYSPVSGRKHPLDIVLAPGTRNHLQMDSLQLRIS